MNQEFKKLQLKSEGFIKRKAHVILTLIRIGPWLTDDLYSHPKFKEFFDARSGECKDGLYPTVTIRQMMWALKMKPTKRERWETYFDKKYLISLHKHSYYERKTKGERTMDELRISTKFMRGIVSKLLSKMLYEKLGYKIDIQLNDINVKVDEGVTRIHLNADAEMENNEFKKFLKFVENEED